MSVAVPEVAGQTRVGAAGTPWRRTETRRWRRAVGAAPYQHVVFVDRLLGALVALRLGLPLAALDRLYGVDRWPVSGAIREVRSLLAARGLAVPHRPGLRLRTLEDVFACAEVEGVKLRIGWTDVQVRCPVAGGPGCKAFVSGKRRQNTINTIPFSDGQGRTCTPGCPGPAECMTRPRCAPRAPPSASGASQTCQPRSTTATGVWPTSSRARSARRSKRWPRRSGKARS